MCDVCSAIKGTGKKAHAPLGRMTAGAPLDRLAVDILGPLPETPRGNEYMLVVTDTFTKWTEIFTVPDQTAATCADKIVNEVIGRYGCPYDLHSDQGHCFIGNLFLEMCKLLEVKKTMTSVART